MTPYDTFIAGASWLSSDAKALYFYVQSLSPAHILPKKAILAKELGIGRDRTTRAVTALRNLGLIAYLHRRHPTTGFVIGTDLLFIPQDRHTAFQYSGESRKPNERY